LTFLPLHAAGLYSQGQNDCVSDYVISSYTPTLAILLNQQPLVAAEVKVMVAIQPEAPGSRTLPYTRKELLEIENIVQHKNLIKLGVEGVPASVENVLSHLSDVSIAHFACHGQQDFADPLESGLILDGGRKLKLSQLMAEPIPKGSLAFLSACQTAMGSEYFPDEGMHLASSMLFAGFRGVVATMW
jgi:CHAT domain-containing protein